MAFPGAAAYIFHGRTQPPPTFGGYESDGSDDAPDFQGALGAFVSRWPAPAAGQPSSRQPASRRRVDGRAPLAAAPLAAALAPEPDGAGAGAAAADQLDSEDGSDSSSVESLGCSNSDSSSCFDSDDEGALTATLTDEMMAWPVKRGAGPPPVMSITDSLFEYGAGESDADFDLGGAMLPGALASANSSDELVEVAELAEVSPTGAVKVVEVVEVSEPGGSPGGSPGDSSDDSSDGEPSGLGAALGVALSAALGIALGVALVGGDRDPGDEIACGCFLDGIEPTFAEVNANPPSV